MKNKVFCVRIEQVYNDDEIRNDLEIFSNEKSAMDYAKEFIADETESVEEDQWEIEDHLDEHGSWEAYEQGYYLGNHTTVDVFEKEIREV